MKLNIRVSGPAGLGMNSTADIIADTFAKIGYEVITNIEYQSVIKGGLNHFDVNVSDTNKSLSKYADILIVFDDKNLENNLSTLRKGAFIISNKKFVDKLKEKQINLSNFKILEIEINDKYDNTYLLGVLFKLLGFSVETSYASIEHTFAKKGVEIVEKNKSIVEEIYKNYDLKDITSYNLGKVGDEKKVSFGNSMIAYGAIENGLEFYSAYPMTPASTILSEVINSKRVNYLQAEDEIAVINAALGASFTGARSMVGTSGGGFALMTEALSFALQAEIPIVAVLAQRAGPSTGTPTCLEQGDINFALNPTFGDFEHIVLVPATMEDGYYMSGLALNLAQKYQTIVIVLIDKQFSEGKSSFSELKTPGIERGKLQENPKEDYKRFELTDDGISPYTKPGTKNGDFIATSYEHDEYGSTTEDSEMKVLMTEKRAKKLQNFYEKENFRGYEVYPALPPVVSMPSGKNINITKPKKYIITTSFISYTAKQFVDDNPEYGLITIKFLKPLDERILEVIKYCEEIIFVEHNYSGQIETYLTDKLGLKFIDGLKISNLRKYDLMPFYIEDFYKLKQ
ncbi:MAG: 2-oxoacid:acceptor oxidoreductase family protein [Candidatus Gracilibacteria bacterium]|nr:2-oxoacid:acceptor oxidoreductase family protein [Candidatus Gracilibacteria bacterium]